MENVIVLLCAVIALMIVCIFKFWVKYGEEREVLIKENIECKKKLANVSQAHEMIFERMLFVVSDEVLKIWLDEIKTCEKDNFKKHCFINGHFCKTFARIIAEEVFRRNSYKPKS